MIDRIYVLILVLLGAFTMRGEQTPAMGRNECGELTLETCLEKGRENYPLIRQYGLLEQTKEVDLKDINNSWLPKIGIYGQGTIQNVVPSFPEALEGVMEQMGHSIKGLGKLQYKVGVDLSQTIWDGGSSKIRREVTERQNGVSSSQLECELYSLRERIQNIYFAVLLTEMQIEQNKESAQLIENNVDKLRIMLKNGTAMQSDIDMAEAQLLTIRQGITQAESAATACRKVLSLYIGEDVGIKRLRMPAADMLDDTNSARPELTLFEKKKDYVRSLNKLQDVALMPKIGLFAQAYYGYPGFNYFESMMNRGLSFNVLAGVKVSWNVDALYSRKNNSRKTELQISQIETERETFLLNNNLLSSSQQERLEGLRKTMADDSRIIDLRAKVRKAAEAQLNNGVIDTFALLTKISDENMANLAAKLHEIQYVEEIYKLRNTLNR